MTEGLLGWAWWQIALFTLVVTHVTIAGVTIFLHRAQAHRALELHPVVSHFFRLWLWLTTGMVTREWVSVHRKHHARCETPDDPHSPQVRGIREVLWRGAELYKKAAAAPEILERYGHGTPDDWLEQRLYGPYSSFGIVLMLVIDLLLFGVVGLTVWAVQMIWIPFFAAGVINGIGHYWGYRNYDSPDAATNIVPWGVLIGGEELHNNHHAFPSSARLSSRPWEFDIGWLYIRLLSAMGLARVKKVSPEPVIIPDKQVVDMETVRAVVVGRMHVLARYARDVLMPVSKDELCKSPEGCRRRYRELKRILSQGDRLDEGARNRLERILDQSQAMETVYRFRQQLKAIWERSAMSQEALLHALQDWCRQAEATGIEALSSFSRQLRGYSLTPRAH